MGRRIPQQAVLYLRKILERMELTLNAEKTRLLDVRKESFDFLGFNVRQAKSPKGLRYFSITPSKRAEKGFRRKVDDYLKSSLYLNDSELTKGLNQKIRGWVNYFAVPGVSHTSKSRQKLSYYLGIKLERYYERKSQRRKRVNQAVVLHLIKHYDLINMARASSLKPVKA